MTKEDAKIFVDSLTDEEVEDLIGFFTELRNKKENPNEQDI